MASIRPESPVATDPSGPTPTDVGAAFSTGNTVYLHGGAISVTINDKAVKSLYYTSAGLVVRHGNNAFSDGGGPQRFSLVSDDGAVRPLSLVTEGVVHATDPNQPYLAYADEVDGVLTVQVRDVSTDEQVAAVPVPDASASFHPISFAGDRIYLGDDDSTIVVEWRTGEVTVDEDLAGSVPYAGLQSSVVGDRLVLTDVATDSIRLEVDLPKGVYSYFSPSPDGRYAKLVEEDADIDGGPGELSIYDVVSGRSVTVPGYAYDYGWTADGVLFRVTGEGEVAVCDATDGRCTTSKSGIERPSDDLRLGGMTYES